MSEMMHDHFRIVAREHLEKRYRRMADVPDSEITTLCSVITTKLEEYLLRTKQNDIDSRGQSDAGESGSESGNFNDNGASHSDQSADAILDDYVPFRSKRD